MTVFWTQTALSVEQEVQPHTISPVVPTHSVGSSKLVKQDFIRGAKYRKRFLMSE
jgi:hypothetical protein